MDIGRYDIGRLNGFLRSAYNPDIPESRKLFYIEDMIALIRIVLHDHEALEKLTSERKETNGEGPDA